MECSRSNDGTYYCIPAIYWSGVTGSLLLEKADFWYDDEDYKIGNYYAKTRNKK